MRKDNLFSLILMALIMMSCSKDETTMSIPQGDNVIEFGTYVGRDAQTRGSVLDIDGLKAVDKGFGVFAHYTGPADYSAGTTKPNFMYNQKVAWAINKWEYTPVKYWPNNVGDKVSFFAYAPYSVGTENNIFDFSSNAGAGGDPTLRFTVDGIAKNQTDLLWGVNASDGLPYVDQQKQTVTGNINFTLKHALARIGFNVEALVDITTGDGSITAGTQIVVTQVELIGGFYKNGELNLNNTVANTSKWTLESNASRTFELSSSNDNFVDEQDYGVSSNATHGQLVTATKSKLNADDSYLMVIPQEFSSANDLEKIQLRVTYDVITADGTLDTGQSKVTNVITSDPFNFTFDSGNAYVFNLHLGLNSVKFDATVTDWITDTSETDVNVPISSSMQPESNSYIIAPNSKGIYIPVSRANKSLLGVQLGSDDVFTAELVWTDNENRISSSSNIAEISTGRKGSSGYIFVKPGSAEGNAVVAVKKDGQILWSWHIWVTEDTPAVLGSKNLMDRNLGAIGNTPGAVGTKGLLYQWGRKDPFPGSSGIDTGNDMTEPTLYTATGTTEIAKTPVSSASNFGNSVSNPSTFYGGTPANEFDWYSITPDTQNNDLWSNAVKTVYDPCPVGWRMAKNDVWSGLTIENFPWDATNLGRTNVDYGGFYPAVGQRNPTTGNINRVGVNGDSWTGTAVPYYSLSFSFTNSKLMRWDIYSSRRTYGFSVRCVKE